MVAHAKDIEDQVNGLWGTFYTGNELQKQTQDMLRERMKEHIKDERLLQGFTPKFEVGCKLLAGYLQSRMNANTIFRP